VWQVFQHYGVKARAVIICLLSLATIITAFAAHSITVSHAASLLLLWLLLALLLLPTRYLLVERLGNVGQLPISDRRAALLIKLNQRNMFECAGLVGIATKKSGTETEQVLHFPKLKALACAPYGFSYDVELPGFYGITAAKATRAQEVIDGYISELLRAVAPEATTKVVPICGSSVQLAIHLRDEFSEIVLPHEVE